MRNKVKQSTNVEEDKKPLILALMIIVGIFIFHATRTQNFFPLNIPDEFTYNFDARLRDPSEVEIPNYLYYFIIRLCDLFGAHYYSAVKVINSLVFVAAAPFAYMIARMVCSRNLSLYLCIVVICWPTSIYTSQFWPEPFYFTAGWVFFWILLRYDQVKPVHQGISVGVCVALLSLIKVHGVFLLPGYLLFALLTFPRDEWRKYIGDVAKSFLVSVAVFCLVKFGFAYLYAGSYGLMLFGKGYGDLATEGTSSLASLTKLVADCLYNLLGHLMVASLVVSLPIMAVCYVFLERAIMPNRLKRLCCIAVSFIIPVICVSVGFSGMLAQLFPTDLPSEETRIQARYYSFIYPLFTIIAGGVLSNLDKFSEAKFWREKWLCCVLVGLAAYAAFSNFHGFTRGILEDYPEGSFLELMPIVPLLLALLPIIACLLSFFRAKKAFKLYIFAFLPLFTVASISVLHIAQALRGIFPNVYDKAGIFVEDYLGDEAKDLVVVDSWLHSAKKAMFHINSSKMVLLPHFDTDVVDMSRVPPDKKWILSFGVYKIPKEYDKFTIQYVDPAQTQELWDLMVKYNTTQTFLGYKLTRIRDFDYSFEFSTKPTWPIRDVLIDNEQINILYAMPLPRKMRMAFKTPTDMDGTVFQVSTVGRVLGTLVAGGEESIISIPADTLVLSFKAISSQQNFERRIAENGMAGFALHADEEK